MKHTTILPRFLALCWVVASPLISEGLDQKSYELNGLPLKLGLFSNPEGEGGGCNLAPKLEEFGLVFEGYERCTYSAHSRTVVILADPDDIELFETLIKNLYAAESLRDSAVELLEYIGTLPKKKQLIFIEKQGFFPDRFVDALAQASLIAQENAIESEAIRARQNLKKALENAIPYLRKQMELIEREPDPNKPA